MTQLLPLLAAIQETGSLALACERTSISYRHAWGLVRSAGVAFGSPLVDSVRGRGAKLTELGDKILWAEKRINARLSPTLESLSTELETELARATSDSHGVLRINASHAFALTALREYLDRRHFPLEMVYKGSSEALESFHHGECDAAGFHVPVGELERPMLARYAKWLKPGPHVLVHLVERRQGVIVAPDNPKHIVSIPDLARAGVRFVNRQPGSGTRLILDHLLEREHIAAKKVRGYERWEYTHEAVAAFIASGMADAGIGVETAARQFHLGFVPLMNERYFLMMRRDALGSPLVMRLLAALRHKEFRMQLVKLQGLDAARCGSIEEIGAAFPALERREKARR